jgi:predicted metal-binding membrane protein
MDKLQKILLFSLILTSALAWVISKDQPDMMKAMMTFDPITVLVFTASWTVGMAAMMFPAIFPMVSLYNRLINKDSSNAIDGIYRGKENLQSPSFTSDEKDTDEVRKRSFFINYSFKIILFVACYLLVWALTGIILLLAWSVPMNIIIASKVDIKQLDTIYGIMLIISGAYQFSPLKTKCIGYCESPFSFFMRRWKSGTGGAIRMGVFHGLYCLGCCWPYFLLMVSLGWMSLLWMVLFSSIIFAEKIWARGLLVARIAGIGLMILGLVAIIFAPYVHSLLGVGGGDSEVTNKGQPTDMEEMPNMGKDMVNLVSEHKQHNTFTNNIDNKNMPIIL